MHLSDNNPVLRKYVQLPRPLPRKLKEDVEDLLNRGFTQNLRSSYSSPCVVVRRKDGVVIVIIITFDAVIVLLLLLLRLGKES